MGSTSRPWVLVALAMLPAALSFAQPPRRSPIERAQALATADALERSDAAAPGNADTLRQLVAAWQAADRPTEAAAALDRLVKADPLDVAARRTLAELRESLGHWRDAIASYTLLGSTTPADASVWRGVGRCELARDREEAAIAAFEKAYDLDKANLETLERLADLYGWNGRQADRVDMLRALLVRRPGDLELRGALARTLMDLDRQREAAFELEKVLAKSPDDIDLRARLADLYEGVGDEPRAAHHLEKLHEAGGADAIGTRELAGYRMQDGQPRIARRLYEEVLAAMPEDVVSQNALVEIDLQILPRITAQYSLFQGRLGYRGHVAELRLDHAPIDPLSYHLVSGYAYREGFSETFGVDDQHQEGLVRLGVDWELTKGLFLEAEATYDGYVDASPFFGGHIGLRERYGHFIEARLVFDRALDTTTLEAITARTIVHGVRLDVDWQPVPGWLLRGSGRYGHYESRDLRQAPADVRVGNDGVEFEAGTGVRILDTEVSLDAIAWYSGVAFDKTDAGEERFPYFAPGFYDAVGVEVDFGHAIGWRLRYGVHAKPYWAITDEAFQLSYGASLEVRVHKKHVLKVTFDRIDTLSGASDRIYNENEVVGMYTGVF